MDVGLRRNARKKYEMRFSSVYFANNDFILQSIKFNPGDDDEAINARRKETRQRIAI